MNSKWKSRKFWICVAAFLASLGSSITGLATGKDWVTAIGIICTFLSSAIYAAAEAYVDAARTVITQEPCETQIGFTQPEAENESITMHKRLP